MAFNHQTNFTFDFIARGFSARGFKPIDFSGVFLYDKDSILVPFKHLYGPRYKHLKGKINLNYLTRFVNINLRLYTSIRSKVLGWCWCNHL